MTYEESVRALMALGRELASPQQARVQKFGLANITTLAEALGNPQRAAPCVHIAGTNGKGSTAAMLESILRTAGFRTGLYTSPHLERINERIRIDGEDISDDQFAAAWTRVHSVIESLLARGTLAAHPTYFECITALAFVAFAVERVNFAIYEVGLGGRLDATNIVMPEVGVITSIDFDHENFLGYSISEIAGEKAGIIKPGAWVVSSAERFEAREVISRRCREQRAQLVEVDAAWRVEYQSASDGRYRAVAVSPDSKKKFTLEPSLAGDFRFAMRSQPRRRRAFSRSADFLLATTRSSAAYALRGGPDVSNASTNAPPYISTARTTPQARKSCSSSGGRIFPDAAFCSCMALCETKRLTRLQDCSFLPQIS